MIHVLDVDSPILAEAPLSGGGKRELYVWDPPGVEGPVPTLLALAAFGSFGPALFGRHPTKEALDLRVSRLIAAGMPPVRIVAPDCYNRVGGSQYVNSSAVGKVEDHLLQEIIPLVESKFAVKNWGVFGHSSGGYGAFYLGARYPETFRAVACHSPDGLFEYSYLGDFPRALDAFSREGLTKWLEKYEGDENKGRGEYFRPLMTLGMAANYSPNPAGELGVDLPFDMETGQIRQEVWDRWKAFDPVVLADSAQFGGPVYMDCGSRDQFALHWACRSVSQKLKARGVDHEYHEFKDGHSGVSYRMDVSLPWLAKQLD